MIKTILVPIGHATDADARIEFAIKLARKNDAHITALHILTPAGDMFKTIPVEAYSVAAYNQFEKDLQAEAELYRNKYEKKLKASGVLFDWCQQQGDILTNLNLHSRVADITILSQKSDKMDDILNVMHDFIIESGLPIILIPKSGTDGDFKNILVAWDGSEQCAKSVHNAIPILKGADKVTILTITEDDKTTLPEADICVKLARHGVNVEALSVDDNMKPEKRILEIADGLGVDLIVSGAWGHRRLRELIFGGVTKGLLSNQKYPIYLSH